MTTHGLISEESLICAIDWVTSTRTDDNENNDIAVANISIAGGGPDTPNCGKGTDPMHYAICRSVRAGVTYAVAAGNAGEDFANTVPATYDEVLTATAMGDFNGKAGGGAAPKCGTEDWTRFGQKDDQPAFFSNFATTRRRRSPHCGGPRNVHPLHHAWRLRRGGRHQLRQPGGGRISGLVHQPK